MNRKGFTLIEMLIVVAIVGLLASVVVLGIGNARERARDAKRAGDIRQIQNAAESYYAGGNNQYPNVLSDMPGAPEFGPTADAYGWEPINAGGMNVGYKVGACLETGALATGQALCPTGFSCGSTFYLCGGSQ